jgi:TetR/AcrR family transcriptional regulator, cholesterol catabolism regulator
MAVELDREALTPNQAARRQRVIDAAMKLASEGGYDAVQMRDVGKEAGVALGTIYRYFASKDHLLAACQLEIWRELELRLDARPLTGATAADRVIDLFARLMRPVEREPLQAAALITASSSPDPAVRECQLEMIGLQDSVFAGAMGELDAARKAHIAQVLRQVWFAALLGWVNGWTDAKAVTFDFEIAVQLLLDDLP